MMRVAPHRSILVEGDVNGNIADSYADDAALATDPETGPDTGLLKQILRNAAH